MHESPSLAPAKKPPTRPETGTFKISICMAYVALTVRRTHAVSSAKVCGPTQSAQSFPCTGHNMWCYRSDSTKTNHLPYPETSIWCFGMHQQWSWSASKDHQVGSRLVTDGKIA
mmetsp:Transcript_44995/g.73318  ORF Transcript_44995/g.73318 Transcript_44995/m.73318 type:complete len:114 (-) Transcript_44995:1682-2023(-)